MVKGNDNFRVHKSLRSISILEKKIKMFNDGTNSKNWGGPEPALTVVVVVVAVFTLAENVKLDVLIRIRLKKVTRVILELQTHKSKIKGVWNGFFLCNNNRLRHKLAQHCLSFCLTNYRSIDGSREATCRMERFGFEPWSGAALRFFLGQVTLISQCLSPPRYINGYRQT